MRTEAIDGTKFQATTGMATNDNKLGRHRRNNSTNSISNSASNSTNNLLHNLSLNSPASTPSDASAVLALNMDATAANLLYGVHTTPGSSSSAFPGSQLNNYSMDVYAPFNHEDVFNGYHLSDMDAHTTANLSNNPSSSPATHMVNMPNMLNVSSSNIPMPNMHNMSNMSQINLGPTVSMPNMNHINMNNINMNNMNINNININMNNMKHINTINMNNMNHMNNLSYNFSNFNNMVNMNDMNNMNNTYNGGEGNSSPLLSLNNALSSSLNSRAGVLYNDSLLLNLDPVQPVMYVLFSPIQIYLLISSPQKYIQTKSGDNLLYMREAPTAESQHEEPTTLPFINGNPSNSLAFLHLLFNILQHTRHFSLSYLFPPSDCYKGPLCLV